MGDVFHALSAPARRAILDELLARDDQTLFELCARLATNRQLHLTRQAVSQHLAVLEDAGLVHTRRAGRHQFLTIDTSPLQKIVDRWPPDRPGATP
jgi:DNA-binding transcriptional ArsR family regulator